MQTIDLNDTVVAIATPPGQGGIGVIRLSGGKAISIADAIFYPANNKRPSLFKNYRLHYGWIKRPARGKKNARDKETVDEALLSVMRGPRSYTKEDVVEIHSHGSVVSLKNILNLILDLGARLAEPGEFTKRAYLNGRIDLTQAEAVLDIIQSKSEAFLRASLNQLKGDLTLALEHIREILARLYTEIEATLNFPDEDVSLEGNRKILAQAKEAARQVKKLLASSEQGRLLKEGIKVVICGKANVGKSSLLNILLKQPRAIVTSVAGTTRDTIEEAAQIKGIPLQLIDTAGFLKPRNQVEKEAIGRSERHLENADLILFMLDSSRSLNAQDKAIARKIKHKEHIVLLNKVDLRKKIQIQKVRQLCPKKKILKISALKRKGIDSLEETIAQYVWQGEAVDAQNTIISNVRHIQALKKCQEAIGRMSDALFQKLPLELIAEENKAAINHLDEITGRNVSGEVLDNIFSSFCIGK